MTTPTNTPPIEPNSPLHPEPAAKEKNIIGLLALIISITGFIFACVPGAMIIGWILLPAAFVLGIVGLVQKNKSKTFALIGLILSVVGTIVGMVMFVTLIGSAVDQSLSGGETTVTVPGEQPKTDDDSVLPKTDDDPIQGGDAEGTRDNPYPIGTAITQGGWTVTINAVNLDATAELTSTDLYNSAPDAGKAYILVNMTATYNGTNPDGEQVWASLAYVTTDGNTIDGTDKFIMVPDAFDSLQTLYAGGSVTGNRAFQIPADSAAGGTLAVTPALLGDKVFVAVS